MLFTWDTTNLCIVFEQWHIRTTPGLIISLIAVVLIAMGYEGLRATCRVYEKSIDARVESAPSESCSSPQVSPPPTRQLLASFPTLLILNILILLVCLCTKILSTLKIACHHVKDHVLCQVCILGKHAFDASHCPVARLTAPRAKDTGTILTTRSL